MKTRNTET